MILEYERSTALKLALMSNVCYDYPASQKILIKGDIIRIHNTRYKVHSRIYDRTSSTEGYIFNEGKNYYIAYKGTHEIKDILLDLLAFKKKIKINTKRKDVNIKIHAGIYYAFNKIKKKLIRELTEIPNDSKIFFTGHSLGASIAILSLFFFLMSKQISEHKKKYVIINVFGSPRIFNKDGQKLLNNMMKYYAVISKLFVYRRDLVTHIPIINYEHIKEIFQLNKNNTVSYKHKKCFPSIRHHNLNNYINFLINYKIY